MIYFVIIDNNNKLSYIFNIFRGNFLKLCDNDIFFFYRV